MILECPLSVKRCMSSWSVQTLISIALISVRGIIQSRTRVSDKSNTL